ncbi:hypothetical protein MSG28_002900 [Choristoneura fumiferana]|uniref:Uncharacterized protein n=1 Tax=Choristoneura fumiferana TaxID=7141 RepID=A0ACC0JJY4_CHOFU|nr:hypothetical protein MSG28_002900 [Choristoneura fumiferana]
MYDSERHGPPVRWRWRDSPAPAALSTIYKLCLLTIVASKPYQAASGAELTKLCNHKRKLLATLQARAQSPSTPPPQQIDQKKVPVYHQK